MVPGTPLLLEASVSKRDENELPRVIIDKVMLLEEAAGELTHELHLHFYAENYDSELVRKIADLCFKVPGKTNLVICFVGKDDSVTFVEGRGRQITVTPELLKELDRLIGRDHYRLRAIPYNPPPRRVWNREKSAEEEKK